MLITKDNFVWKRVRLEQAKRIFKWKILELYIVYADESESLVTNEQDIILHFNRVYIEVGHIKIVQGK